MRVRHYCEHNVTNTIGFYVKSLNIHRKVVQIIQFTHLSYSLIYRLCQSLILGLETLQFTYTLRLL